MTEDMLNEQTDLLMGLGSSSEGSMLRAKVHSDHLLSDMQAFKVRQLSEDNSEGICTECPLCTQAANPGAVLEDFVRWHSPRDWIEDAALQDRGQLPKRRFSFAPQLAVPFACLQAFCLTE